MSINLKTLINLNLFVLLVDIVKIRIIFSLISYNKKRTRQFIYVK